MDEKELWIGVVHLKPLTPRDWSALDGDQGEHSAGAYTNIITWASCAGEFRANVEKLAADCKLYIVDIER